MDYDFVNERVAVGAAIGSTDDIAVLKAAGITDVVDCQIEHDDTPDLGADFAVLWIGVSDDGQPKPVEWFQKGIEFAANALARPNRRVYFHCAAGVNRGPSMCYAYLRSQGWNPVEAETYIRAVRPQVGIAYKLDADAAITSLGY